MMILLFIKSSMLPLVQLLNKKVINMEDLEKGKQTLNRPNISMCIDILTINKEVLMLFFC